MYLNVNIEHGDVILNRSNNSVFLLQKSVEIGKPLSHLLLGNLNKARNASSTGFFLQMLDSIFRSIY